MGRLLLIGAMLCAAGCSASAQNVKRATVLGTYEAELDACIVRGRTANSYAVYEACANEVDARFGVTKKAQVSQ